MNHELERAEAELRRMFHGKPKDEDMTTPAQPVAGDPGTPDQNAAVQQQLAGQAAGVAGTDSAGIFGDAAGRQQQLPPQTDAQVAADLQAKGAVPAQADPSAILDYLHSLEAKLGELQAAHAATEAAKPQAAKPPVLEEILSALSGVTPGLVHALTVIAERLDAAGI